MSSEIQESKPNPLHVINIVALVVVALLLIKLLFAPAGQTPVAEAPVAEPVEAAQVVEPVAPPAPVAGGLDAAREIVTALAASNSQKIEAEFSAEGGMTGFVLSSGPGDASIFYINPEGSLIIPGPLMSIQGENLSEAHLAAHLPKPDFTAAFAALEERAMTSGMTTGEAESSLFVIYEPHCGACMALHRVIGEDDTQITWVPVSFLSNDSPAVAAAMVNSDDPAATLKQIQNPQERSALASEFKDRAEEGREITNGNWQLASQFGARGTPTIIWKDRESGEISVYTNVPSAEMYREIVSKARKG